MEKPLVLANLGLGIPSLTLPCLISSEPKFRRMAQSSESMKRSSRPLYRTPRLLAETMWIKSNWNRDKYVFLKLLRKGDTVLDVGGNISDYCTTFAKAVGPKGMFTPSNPYLLPSKTLKEPS